MVRKVSGMRTERGKNWDVFPDSIQVDLQHPVEKVALTESIKNGRFSPVQQKLFRQWDLLLAFKWNVATGFSCAEHGQTPFHLSIDSVSDFID
mgnify:CR=1 FL=1